MAEGAIKAATLELARSGLYVEPTCAQAAAAYHELLASGAIQPAEVAVVLLTGTGLGSVSEVSRKRLGDGGRAHRDGRQGDAARGRDPRGRVVRRPGHRRRQTIARGERHRADARAGGAALGESVRAAYGRSAPGARCQCHTNSEPRRFGGHASEVPVPSRMLTVENSIGPEGRVRR